MGNFIFRTCRHFSILAIIIALVGVTTSVQAASFRKSWDPEFSDAFSALVGVDVGWRGEALLFVDNNCVTSSAVVNFLNACGTASLQSYELEFYDVGTNAILGTGSDTAPGTPVFPAVTAVSFDASAIANGVSLAGPLFVPGVFSFGEYPLSFRAQLTFDLTGPSLTLRENCDNEICPSYENDGTTYPPDVTWSQVPVPATLALFGIGLAGLGWSRRRKL